MFNYLTGGGKAADSTPVHSLTKEQMATLLKESTPTEEIVSALLTYSFTNMAEKRAFVLDVVPHLNPENLHILTNLLIHSRLAENGRSTTTLMQGEGIEKVFLGYEFVHNKKEAVQHIQVDGAFTSGLRLMQRAAIATGMISMPEKMPEVAHFLFLQRGDDYSGCAFDAATLTSARDDSSEEAQRLNQIDGFIIKYFVAELDEIRKQQQERRVFVDGEFVGFRGGFKAAVGLDIRHALVHGKNAEKMQAVFSESLERNHLTADDFFDGKTRHYIQPELEAMLTDGAAPGLTG